MVDAGRVLLLVLILLLIHCSLAQHSFLNSTSERIALLDLRSSLGLRSSDWPIKSDPCNNWNGIQCKNGRVTGINISGFKRTHIGGSNPSFSVDSLVNLTFLEYFNASGFSLPGSIPSWFGYGLGSLQVLDLRSTSMSGPLPDSLGNLTRLDALHLSDNNLAGSIPSALGQLMQLSVLDLSRNFLTGQIPTTFALLSNLSRLDLSSNYLTGSIPPGLGNIDSLKSLNLYDNNLAASIPVELGNLSHLVELNLAKNSLSGSLPVELAGLKDLVRMEIGDNGLEGWLPDGLFSSLKKLQVVVLSGNKFDGALPEALLSLPSLRVLDVSYNNFTGVISTFSSNAPLPEAALKKRRKRWIYILVGLFGGLGFIVILVLVMIVVLRRCHDTIANQKGSANVGPVPEGDSPSLPKDPVILSGFRDSFTYEQLLCSTSEFDDANLIKSGHSGDLFRGFLDGGSP
ncbi:hypothetical protein GH714_006019 [Hevea brasiliensis]|uniref:Leucine-rich repeat-containing N-terminal plant-type domain-containing protein n=1 Tax=Hevea brasiliensis TaxID=3981 RepID=A0A6A6LJW1_HEVBR|nr:hypothetical protein GH714_006019 [Hevea brasiliensis]